VTNIRLQSRKSGTKVAALLTSALLLVVGFFAAAPASADTYPDGYPKWGATSESVDGYRVYAGGEGGVLTRLHPVFFGPTESPELAYCVELTVGTQPGKPLDVIDWDSFPGNNHFKANAGKVTWIVFNSFPEISLEAFAAQAGIPGLTAEEAITGTQAAIWTLTEGPTVYTYRGLTGDVPAGAEARVGTLVDYLTGEANTGLPETQAPSVEMTPSSQAGQAGELVGPVTITASADTVAVSITGDHMLVTRDGLPVDLNRVPTGTELFLDVPADAPAGSVTLTATLAGSVSTGLLVTPEPRGQTIMVATTNSTTVSAQSVLTWAAVPRIATWAADAVDGDEFLPQDGPATVIDTVRYEGLVPGTEYEVRGELMIHDGEEGTPSGITATKTFTPTEADGTVELTFEVPADMLRGEQVVVFESLYADDVLVTVHADIDDANQTVYRPDLATDAYDQEDKDKSLAAGGGTVSDDVAYSGLVVGETYVVRGELVDQATGEGTGIVSEATFTAEASSGIVTLDFEVPESQAGNTLVVFERLYLAGGEAEGEDEVLLAVHEDLEDARQTVVVQEGGELPSEETPSATPTPSPTGGESALPSTGVNDLTLAAGGALALLALGAGLVARRRVLSH
jgi:TQXA domain-containing protein/LPXTG-motif cell wall-anchored protein